MSKKDSWKRFVYEKGDVELIKRKEPTPEDQKIDLEKAREWTESMFTNIRYKNQVTIK